MFAEFIMEEGTSVVCGKSTVIKGRSFVCSNTGIVPWTEIRNGLLSWEFEVFMKWIRGQTTTPDGVYVWDLSRFLDSLNPVSH